MLAEARGLLEVRDVHALAIAAAAYARARDLGEDAVRSASRIVILATVRIGEEIAAGQEAGTVARPNQPVSQYVDGPDIPPATLPELGISRDLASTGQRLAAHPDAVRDYLAETSVPSIAGALRAAARDADEAEGELFGRFLTPEEVPIGAAWDDLREVIRLVGRLAAQYDATTLAIAVPARKRSATARKLRSLGTDLGRVAMMLERTGALPVRPVQRPGRSEDEARVTAGVQP
jgi:hypothetical protein